MKLTKREMEVSTLAASGLRSKAIAERLQVSEKTIRFHLCSTYRKLGINRRSQLPKVIRGMKQNEDEKCAELAMKITSSRNLWMMRAFVLKNMLAKLNVDAEWVFDTSKEELEALLAHDKAKDQQNA